MEFFSDISDHGILQIHIIKYNSNESNFKIKRNFILIIYSMAYLKLHLDICICLVRKYT